MICIYQIRNITNNKIYIGSTKNFHKRKLAHLRSLKNKYHHNIYLQRAYNKYGLKNFVFEILEKCTINDLFPKEEFWIDKKAPEYNIGSVCGGDNYTKHPNKDILKARLTKQLRNAKRPGPKYREKNPNWRGGKTFFLCPKCKKEIRRSSKNQKTCGKCTDRSGKNNAFYNKKHSKETKEKLRKNRLGSKNISCSKKCSIDGKIYYSVSDASKKLNIHPATMSHRIRSKNKKFENYFFVNE